MGKHQQERGYDHNQTSAANSLHDSNVSFSSPSEEWQRRALRGRSPDLRPNFLPTLRAFPSVVGQWLLVADFVAVHSCEGSGGVAPLFPYLLRIVVLVGAFLRVLPLVPDQGRPRRDAPTSARDSMVNGLPERFMHRRDPRHSRYRMCID